MGIKKMDIVGRKSYRCDILFRVIDIKEQGNRQFAILYGEDFRLIADAPFDDLVKINPSERAKKSKGFRTLEEQSLELFKQDIHLLKERREFEINRGICKTSKLFSNSWKSTSFRW